MATITKLASILGNQFTGLGRVYFVKKSSDTEYTDWLRRVQAAYRGQINVFETINAAYDATRSNCDDVILISQGSHTLTTKLTVSNSRTHFIGMEYFLGMRRLQGQPTKINMAGSTAGNDAVFENTGVRNTFRGLRFWNSNTST